MTSYTTSLRLWQGTPGDPAIRAAWGIPLNTNDTLIDQAINQQSAISLSGLATYTLTTNNGAPDQARGAVLNFQSGTQTCVVTLPNAPRVGWAVNNSGFTVTLTAGAGTQAAVPADGLYHLYVADGSGNVTLPSLTQTPTALSGASLTITGNATIGGTLGVTGTTTLGSLNLTSGLIGVNGQFANLTITNTSFLATATAQNLTVNQSSQLSTLQVSGQTILQGPATVAALTCASVQTSGAGVASFGTGTNIIATAAISPNQPNGIIAVNTVQPQTSQFTCFSGNLGSALSLYATFTFGGSLIGSIAPNSGGSGVLFNTTSDRTLKNYVFDLGEGCDTGGLIDRLKAVWFRWKDGPVDADPEPGFFAQAVHRIWPWAVTKGRGRKGRNGYKPWQMDNSKLVPLLVAELQALRVRVRHLERLNGV